MNNYPIRYINDSFPLSETANTEKYRRLVEDFITIVKDIVNDDYDEMVRHLKPLRKMPAKGVFFLFFPRYGDFFLLLLSTGEELNGSLLRALVLLNRNDIMQYAYDASCSCWDEERFYTFDHLITKVCI